MYLLVHVPGHIPFKNTKLYHRQQRRKKRLEMVTEYILEWVKVEGYMHIHIILGIFTHACNHSPMKMHSEISFTQLAMLMYQCTSFLL